VILHNSSCTLELQRTAGISVT